MVVKRARHARCDRDRGVSPCPLSLRPRQGYYSTRGSDAMRGSNGLVGRHRAQNKGLLPRGHSSRSAGMSVGDARPRGSGAGQPSSGTSNIHKSPSTVVTQIHQRTNNHVAEHWRSAKKVHPRMIPQQRVPSSSDGLPALATQRQLPSLPSRSFPPSPPSLPPPHDS